MSLDLLLSETVVIVSPGLSTDDDGQPVFVWGDAATRTTVKARLTQVASTEVTLNRDTVASDWVLYLHRNVSVSALDRVEAEGRTFEVVGAPDQENAPRGPRGVDHVRAQLRHLDG